ncbi:MAG: hypothetical protein GF313_02535 [Caldithrix sp.]|nr:hypothetical protein [Caldithrix sp.]
MYQIIHQEENSIEILLTEHLEKEEFIQVIHQLESLCTMYQNINVLFDTAGLEKYDFKLALSEFSFYKDYKTYLKRVALVSDRKTESFLLEQFNKFSETEFRTFREEFIEEARNWIFPSKLPR